MSALVFIPFINIVSFYPCKTSCQATLISTKMEGMATNKERTRKLPKESENGGEYAFSQRNLPNIALGIGFSTCTIGNGRRWRSRSHRTKSKSEVANMDFHKSYATMAGCQQNPTHPWFCHVVWVSHPNTMKPTEAKQNGNFFAPYGHHGEWKQGTEQMPEVPRSRDSFYRGQAWKARRRNGDSHDRSQLRGATVEKQPEASGTQRGATQPKNTLFGCLSGI